ncbi:hypothetical protein CH333_01110 [candidate division WOR-3 bacterium JGI_Cruoil_03_44_89]|uniref:Outer membrane protein beta-barrel domain-containing protein n=1 Tax=candidate division WOR-3 bacterium JGI_Cruoil_03_44_89 TaxID=1973748 RepID=A0A235C0K1_UNCW3|nr:MAG: hypothetical protein CH333_01110 [candidate division WOR-3 bacterium JGI_Cruoil_03_44_89]
MVHFILLSLVIATQPKVGFGIGQTLGSHLLTPSLFTMRVPLGESFVIAPELNFAYSSSDAEIDSVTGSNYTVGIEGNLHYAILKRNKTSLYGIGGIGFKISKDTRNWYEHWYPDSLVEIEEVTSSHSYGINLGLGMEQFLRDNLSIYISSLSNITRTSEEKERKRDGEEETIRKNTDLSLDFQNLKCCIYLIWYIL